MTKIEFGTVMNYIRAATGVEFRDGMLDVYFDCLGDLSSETLQLVAKRVLMEHRWSNFPSIAELREAAALTIRGEVSGLSPAEGWELAWKAICKIDLDVDDSLQRATKGLPPIVVDAMDAMGIANLVGGEDPVAVVRAQFLKVFEQLAARDKRLALLPASTREAIEQHRPQGEIAAPVKLAIAGIGKDVA